MKRKTLTLSLIAMLSGLGTATRAQVVVWSQNFDSELSGPYGAHLTDFGSSPAANPDINIVSPGQGGTGQAYQFTFDVTSGGTLNIQGATLEYPASGNTSVYLKDYTLDFDMAIEGQTPGFGMEIGIFGPGSWIFNGDALRYTLGAGALPTAGSGYQHFSIPLSQFSASGAGPLNPTDSSLSIGFGCQGFPPAVTASPETILVDNIVITTTNAPPLPPPTMQILAAKPGLRIFGQNFSAPWNQEGFGTVDASQSWIGATPGSPRKYSIVFQDFDTVDGYTFYAQFVPNSGGVNPYVVFVGPHALVWSITRQSAGFTTSVNWKTNLPNSATFTNALNLTTASTNGRGTWTLTFTNDTDGTVTAPDGSSGSFALPADTAALFADPLTILFGTAPNSTAGYGQWVSLSRLTITNVAGVNEDDDFTKDDVLDTGLWDPAFSVDAGSVIQVSTNTPYWVNWTVPDPLFGLATKADLGNTNIAWHTPAYYSGGAVTLTPRQMGPSLKWVLIPNSCLPTADGTTNGPVSSKACFIMVNPAPTQ